MSLFWGHPGGPQGPPCTTKAFQLAALERCPRVSFACLEKRWALMVVRLGASGPEAPIAFSNAFKALD